MEYFMNIEQIADSVKRLRELGAKRPKGGEVVNFTIRLKQIWDERACESFHNMTDRACAYGDAIQTINALVDLVWEMHNVLGVYGDPLEYSNVQEMLDQSAPIAAL